MLGILLDNATRHTSPQGCIRVGATPGEDGADVALVVEDEGEGIPDGVLEALFEFGHGDRDALVGDGQPGLGIGLWVCRELAARNGGTVSVTRAASGGTSASIVLPAARGMSDGL
jgi:signal transduction histidine kinase